MSSLFYVIKNQDGQYLAKNHIDWLGHDEQQLLFSSRWYDEAFNTLIKVSIKNIELKITVETVQCRRGQTSWLTSSHPIVKKESDLQH